MAKDYDKLAYDIVERVGGSDNITFATHCMTRLRLQVKDQSKIQVEEIKTLPGVLGTQFAGEQFQIIIGQSVGDLYKTMVENNYVQAQEAVKDNLDSPASEKKTGFKAVWGAILDGLTGSLAPLIPLLLAGGLIKVIQVIGIQLGLLTDGVGTAEVLGFCSNAAFYFLPVYVSGYTAKKFGGNTGLGMMLGAILIAPELVQAVSSGETLSIFGLSIYGASYASTIFPAFLSVWIMCKVEKFVTKHSPEILRAVLEPLVTMIVMIPLSLLALAPLGSLIGDYVGIGLNWLLVTLGPVGWAITSALTPLLIVVGMHLGMLPFVLQQLATNGYMTIPIPGFLNNWAQGVAALAVGIKTKDKALKSAAITAGMTAIVAGISEPALFGVTLQHRKALIASMIGLAVGGAMVPITGVKLFAFTASGGVFGIPSFIGDPASNLTMGLICIAVTVVVTFLMTLLLYKDEGVKK